MHRINFFGLIVLFFLTANVQGAFSQTKVTGLVLDQSTGKGIEGVNIGDKKIGSWGKTDSTGLFEIIVNESRFSLRFSAIGYQPQEAMYSVSDIPLRILLQKETLDIEEVEINTGYQWIPKERATGSFVHIDREKLEQTPGRSILSKLDGIMPGLQFDNRNYKFLEPDATPPITVRGLNAFGTAGASPLIVVDNFPYYGEVTDIHPEDVESVTLLRDAAATSIYGVNAGNGVLIINLKKADRNRRISGSWSSSLNIVPKPDLYYPSMMTSSEFVDTELFLYEQGFYRSALTGSNAFRTVFSPVVQGLYDVEKGTISQTEFDQILRDARQHDYRKDLLKYFYRNSVNWQNMLSLSGSTGMHSWRVSIGMDRVEGVGNKVRTNTSNQYSARLNHSFRFSKRFTMESNLGFVHAASKAGNGLNYPVYIGSKNAYPYLQLFDSNNNAKAIPTHLNPRYLDTLSQDILLDWSYNPYEDIDLSQRVTRRLFTSPNLLLKYELVEGLYIEGYYGGEFQLSQSRNIDDENSYYARDMMNRYTHIQNGTVVRPIPYGDILYMSDNESYSHKVRVHGKMNKYVFSRDHISWIVGGELQARHSQGNSSRFYGYNPDLAISIPMNHASSYPLWFGGTGTITSGQGFSENARRLVSVYGNMSYSIADKYILSGSARKDASNVFGVKTNERWNPLWSVGFAWNAKNEKFLQNLSWLNALKFRITHGHSGSIGGGTTDRVVITYSASNASHTNLPYAIITSPPNPSLKWENVEMNNLGLEFGLFKGIISGSIEYYRKTVTDLISLDPLDKTTGFASIYRNVGGIKGEGIDAMLNYRKKSGQFSWDLNNSFSYVRDWVTDYYGTTYSAVNYADKGGTSVFPVVGRPLQGVYSFNFAGLDPNTGDPLGYYQGEQSKDYPRLLTDSLHNLIYHGSARPLYFGFVNNHFRYKSWSLSMNIVYRAGNFVRMETINYNDLYNSWSTHGDFGERWIQPGDEEITIIPSMIYPTNANRDRFYALSTATVQKGDVIKLDQIYMGYQWNMKLSGIQGLNIGLNAKNLATIWSAVGKRRDPDYLNIPPARSISVRMVLQF